MADFDIDAFDDMLVSAQRYVRTNQPSATAAQAFVTFKNASFCTDETAAVRSPGPMESDRGRSDTVLCVSSNSHI